MRANTSRRAAVGVLVATVLIASACGGSDDTATSATSGTEGSEGTDGSGGEGEVVVFGTNTELSGAYQTYGIPQQVALERFEQDFADGLEVNGTMYRVDTILADNRSDPTAVAAAAQQVIDAGAIVAVGPDINAEVAHAAWNEAGILGFTVGFTAQLELEFDQDARPLQFTPVPWYSSYYLGQAQQVATMVPDIKKAVVLYPSILPPEGKQSQVDAAAANGWEQTIIDYPVETTDFSSYLSQVKDFGADVLILPPGVSRENALAIVEQASQFEAVQYMMSDIITPDEVLALGDLNLDVILPTFAPSFSSAATLPRYDPAVIFGDDTNPVSPAVTIVVWYALHLAAQAMQDAGTTTDAAAIAAKLPGQSFDGPFGTCAMDGRSLSCETPLFKVAAGQVEAAVFANNATFDAPLAEYVCNDKVCTEK
jgi:ABC-type branched-subunit amino acid transport system substrate-binding protein